MTSGGIAPFTPMVVVTIASVSGMTAIIRMMNGTDLRMFTTNDRTEYRTGMWSSWRLDVKYSRTPSARPRMTVKIMENTIIVSVSCVACQISSQLIFSQVIPAAPPRQVRSRGAIR